MNDYHSKLSFLAGFLGKHRYSANTHEAEFFCPFCKHHKQKFSVNIETDNYKCWVCGIAGKNLGFPISKISPRNLREYFEKYKAKSVKTKFYKTEDEFILRLPEEFVPITECKNSILGMKAINYLVNVRGIEEIDILRYKIGTALEGEYADSIIFPSFDSKGEVNFYMARYADGRKKHPEVPRGYRSQIISNELNLDWKKPIVIVEGFTDLLKTTGNAIPLFGSSLHPNSAIFQTIVEKDVPVFLALDADALAKSDKIAKNFMRYDVSCYIVPISPFNDVGEMSKSEFKTRYENASPVTKESVFKNRLRAIC